MFRIKICGITNLRDADAAITADAEALGLNFYEKSPRRVGLDEAVRISRLAAVRKVVPVGVFVNHSPDAIDRIAAAAELAFIQLHGDEPPECVAQVLAQLRRFVIRARRIGDDGVAAVLRDIEACRAAGAAPGAVLIDALTPGRYGGTGETVSWMGIADHERWLGDTPLILAGGLTPENVAEAIRIVRPHAVDVASGVESAPGKKDPHKVRDFIHAAKAAFGM